ncbi:uncharacterized protein ACA1_153610 [Acanthamoeba castellanii str. Neff]|jgi:hypothetical protein|uniref:Arrestin C-terminal-like domain-containing protein n=1 Tax=Acanthamoeba castellanii (strain ATCC 30010 / Neff) TaxID=1257118 RepID=L8HIC7_ACACF|nr:uncharacterized protein ACA1_153610 [Acanthamoeba castellanii str. Neff]ELR24131.1 hypothetical protein ACA1_153610 [Acanthamoeba castellanii str. Neff]
MSSSEDERKKRSDSESEEESEEVESEEEETSEEESEEETSEEESTSSDKTSSSASAKATPRSATTTPRAEAKKEPEIYNPPKTKAKEDNGDKKNGKADKKKKSKKSKKNDEQSVVVIDGRTVLKKTYELAKDKVIEFTVSIENRNYKPEEKVELKFEIKNQTSKTMKSIKCVVETKGAKPEGDSKDKKKKQKKPKKGEAERGVPTGTEDEFYCGARFPLDKYTDFKGTDSYRLPKKIDKSSGTVKHELHLSFPIRSRPINSWKNIDAWLPIEIGN